MITVPTCHAGADVGGLHGNAKAELTVWWNQLAIQYLFFRLPWAAAQKLYDKLSTQS